MAEQFEDQGGDAKPDGESAEQKDWLAGVGPFPDSVKSAANVVLRGMQQAAEGKRRYKAANATASDIENGRLTNHMGVGEAHGAADVLDLLAPLGGDQKWYKVIGANATAAGLLPDRP